MGVLPEYFSCYRRGKKVEGIEKKEIEEGESIEDDSHWNRET